MQISRRVVLACVASSILLPQLSQADTEAQIKARQALEQAMGQPQAAPAQQPVAKPAIIQAPPAAKPAVATPPAAPVASAPKTPAVKSASQANIEKAREALRQKMSELENAAPVAQPQTAAPQVSTVAPEKPVAPANPVTPAAPVVPVPATSPMAGAMAKPTPQSNANIEKAREALRQKMSELENSAPVQSATTVAPVVPQTTAVVPSAAPAAVPFADEAVRPKQASEADMEKARQALREKMGQIEQKAETTEVMKPVVPEAVTTEEKEVKKAEKPKPAVKSKNAMAWTPLPAPATGLSPAKEQKLQALLDDYKADKLTPEQYHEERAKILGEP